MNSVVSGFILKTLCDNCGSLDFGSLEKIIRRSCKVSESDLSRLLSDLSDHDNICVIEGKQRVVGGQAFGPDTLIVAKTSLRLCQRKPGECPRCDGLHLCKFYVCGGCTFGTKCKNSHILPSLYNAQLLKTHGLQDLTEKQLFQLLLQNDPFLLPEICPHYNKGNGLHGSCRFASTCTKLHVCQHYFQGDCKFGPSCKRVHNIGECDMKMFKGLGEENVRHLNEIYRNKTIIMAKPDQKPLAVAASPEARVLPLPASQSGAGTSSACSSNPLSEADRNEICLYNIRTDCRYKEKCARIHSPLPYSWQTLHSDGVTWKDLPHMEDIERAYCDPGRNTSGEDQQTDGWVFLKYLSLQNSMSSNEQTVDFMRMTCGGSRVRRLSTASSVLKPPHFILTTQWIWYWKDEDGAWLEYGQGEADRLASVTSSDLENIYLADSDTEVQFTAGGHKYILHFKGEPGIQQMYQQNIKYKTKREVRRRPRFVSAQDVKDKQKSPSSHGPGLPTAESFPPHWDKTALPDVGYKLVPLSKSQDFSLIEKLFKSTMPHSKIHSIKRIQNPSLWGGFQWQKEQMKRRNGGKAVNQLYLFHGTDETLIDAICDQNFDWRMCGVHGTHFGKGSYFAKDASYSDRFASVNRQLKKTMFVALVLVGEYTKGSSSYVRPPPKADKKTLYDSCVNSESDPKIFVVFEKQQIYPEYLISYS